MASLFVPFEGVNEKRSDIEGIGVGLALSHRLVSLMGGRLDVASTVGEGSTFSVSMPLAAAMPAGASASGRESSGVGPEIIRSTLLLIEDDKSTVALVGRILELRPDWGIVSASSGSHGMELAHSLKPTVILIDATLPDMDSVDIIRGLRSNAAIADTPLVILSPDGSRTEIRRFQSAGATQHITTPLDVREVLALFDAYANQPHNSAA
jgi:CheY-like chemotaxis protein